MIFANLKNGCKRACNLVKNNRAVRLCALVAVCLTFNVATALADSGAGYEAGKNAISQAIIGACVFLIAAAQALPLFFGIEDGVITGF